MRGIEDTTKSARVNHSCSSSARMDARRRGRHSVEMATSKSPGERRPVPGRRIDRRQLWIGAAPGPQGRPQGRWRGRAWLKGWQEGRGGRVWSRVAGGGADRRHAIRGEARGGSGRARKGGFSHTRSRGKPLIYLMKGHPQSCITQSRLSTIIAAAHLRPQARNHTGPCGRR